MRLILPCIASLLFSEIWYLGAQPSCRPTVPVIVIDQKANAPLDALTVGDFQAKSRGGEIPIRNITTPSPSLRLVFVIDRSGSLHRDDSFRSGSLRPREFFFDGESLESQALHDVVSMIPPTDLVAFLAFSGKCSRRTEFAAPDSAKGPLADILEWSPDSDCTLRTPLWDKINDAIGMFNTHAPGDTIIVISDGGDNMSKLSRSHVQKELLSMGVPVFAILVASPIAAGPEERIGPSNLADLAEATGGTITIPESQPRWPLAFDPTQLLPMLAHQYELTVEIPESDKPEEWHLTVKAAERRRDIKILYPRYLYPCAVVQ